MVSSDSPEANWYDVLRKAAAVTSRGAFMPKSSSLFKIAPRLLLGLYEVSAKRAWLLFSSKMDQERDINLRQMQIGKAW
jgi:hypothetical protein